MDNRERLYVLMSDGRLYKILYGDASAADLVRIGRAVIPLIEAGR